MRATLALLAALSGAPCHAGPLAPDPGQVPCKALMGMDNRQRITVAMATKEALPAEARLQALSDQDVLTLALKACASRPDATVLKVMTN